MKRINILLIVLLLTGALFAQNTKIMYSKDNKISVNIPQNWNHVKLNDVADIETGNATKGEYLMIISESKSALSDWGLDKYGYWSLNNVIKKMGNPTIDGPFKIRINGYNAFQFIVKGKSNNLDITYVMTAVESPSRYNQILAWSLQSTFDNSKNNFDNVIYSFKEN